jgi:hypothetical protein
MSWSLNVTADVLQTSHVLCRLLGILFPKKIPDYLLSKPTGPICTASCCLDGVEDADTSVQKTVFILKYYLGIRFIPARIWANYFTVLTKRKTKRIQAKIRVMSFLLKMA